LKVKECENCTYSETQTIPPDPCGTCVACTQLLDAIDMTTNDGKVILTNIDEETIKDHNITFRWFRRLADGTWEQVQVPSDQPWVDLSFDDNQEVMYKVEIYVDDEPALERERTFNPPPDQPNFWQPFIILSAVGILGILAILFMIIAIKLRDKEQEKTN
jgi:hypothetical protein